MPTLQQSFDLQQAEGLRNSIAVDENLLTGLTESLRDLELRETRARKVVEAATCLMDQRMATSSLEKLNRQHAELSQRLSFAKQRVKSAKDQLSKFNKLA